jgi:hypothetical protein
MPSLPTTTSPALMMRLRDSDDSEEDTKYEENGVVHDNQTAPQPTPALQKSVVASASTPQGPPPAPTMFPSPVPGLTWTFTRGFAVDDSQPLPHQRVGDNVQVSGLELARRLGSLQLLRLLGPKKGQRQRSLVSSMRCNRLTRRRL